MGFTAIICEFNPLHNGHKALLSYARENFEDDILCLMSGNFVQRGEPAVLGKFERAETAVKEGADLVLELPVYFAESYAESFAMGAISILSKIDAKRIVFGSECGDIDKLSLIADISLYEPIELQDKILNYLSKGLLYAAARNKAIADIYGKDVAKIIETPNNILGIEYIKAIKRLNANITPVTIRRLVDDEKYASSSYIRENVSNDTTRFIPQSSIEKKDAFLDVNKSNETLFKLLQYKLINTTKGDLYAISEVTEGLENKILQAILESSSFEELCENIKSKRYTMAKIKRILLSALLGIKYNTAKQALDTLSYVNALAVRKDKCELLKGNNKLVIAKSDRDISDKNELFEISKKADKLYLLLSGKRLDSKPTSVRIVE